MTRKKRLLVLGGPHHQIRFLQRAKQLGIHIGLVDINPDAPARPYADEFFQCSVLDQKMILEHAKAFMPDGITHGLVDRSILPCAIVAYQMGLPGIGVDVAVKATNKFDMIKTFEEHKVPHPKYEYVPSNEAKSKITTAIPYPLIIKPIDSRASMGVFLVQSQQELQKMIPESAAAGVSGAVLIEEFLSGLEFNVDFIVINGVPSVVQITEKIGYEPPSFAGTGVIQPARISEEDWQETCSLVCHAAKAVGFLNCVGHADVKLTNTGPKILELAPRPSGFCVGERMVELSTGISTKDISIRLALGQELSLPKSVFHRGCCTKYILSKKGIIKDISCVEQARKHLNIVDITVLAKVGDVIGDVQNKESRILWVLAEGANAEEAERACDEAIQTISISYE